MPVWRTRALIRRTFCIMLERTNTKPLDRSNQSVSDRWILEKECFRADLGLVDNMYCCKLLIFFNPWIRYFQRTGPNFNTVLLNMKTQIEDNGEERETFDRVAKEEKDDDDEEALTRTRYIWSPGLARRSWFGRRSLMESWLQHCDRRLADVESGAQRGPWEKQKEKRGGLLKGKIYHTRKKSGFP